jgi:hypothetical protein
MLRTLGRRLVRDRRVRLPVTKKKASAPRAKASYRTAATAEPPAWPLGTVRQRPSSGTPPGGTGPDRNPTTNCCLLAGAGGRGLRLRRTRPETAPVAGPQSSLVRRSVCKAISVNHSPEIPGVAGGWNGSRHSPEHNGDRQGNRQGDRQHSRDLASISAAVLVPATALELMSGCGASGIGPGRTRTP